MTALRRHNSPDWNPGGQPNWPDYFDARMWFAFLLRTDVTGDSPRRSEEDHKRFLMWWLCIGRREYGGAPVTPEQRRIAWEEVIWNHPAGPHRIPRILAYVLEIRQDVADGIGARDDGGLHRALAWLFLYGLREMELPDLVDDGVRAWLNAPADPVNGASGDLPLTNLAALVWRFRTRERASLPLSAAENDGIAAWVYSVGLAEEDIGGLLSEAVAGALTAPVVCQGGLLRARHAYLCWQAGFPGVPPDAPTTAEAVARLNAWHASVEHAILTTRLTPPQIALKTAPRGVMAAGPPTRKGCNLIGYAYGELGIGEDVRMMARSLEADGVPFNIVDFSERILSRKSDGSAARHISPEIEHRATVFCLTGFDTTRFLIEKGEDAFRDRRVIGYWPWELPRWPELWRAAFALVDEIWVSSRFTQEAFCLDAPIPVIHMPMAVELPAMTPLSRARFGLPERQFLFLYVFDANSYLDRKNPFAAVAAFRRAFPHGNEAVSLVLKVMNASGNGRKWREFLDQCAADPRIRIIHDTLDKPDVMGLMNVCDCYLSLHRSEGFGRTIAEAMLLGKPVIATAWSGSDELVRHDTAIPVAATLRMLEPGQYPWGEGQHWADPDVDHAAWAMRQLAGNADAASRLGRAGCEFVRSRHNPQVVGRRYRARLSALGVL